MPDRFPGPHPARAGLCCDFDGTLAPIVADPRNAAIPEALRPVLTDLASRLGVFAVVSTRPAAFLGEYVRVPGARLLGLYGLQEWTGDRVWLRPEAAVWQPAVDDARARLEARLADHADHPGVWVEDKGLAVAIHWRNAADRAAGDRDLWQLAKAVAADTGLALERGKFVAELRPPVDWDKGATVRTLTAEHDLERVAYVGDDRSDLLAFAAVKELGGVTIAVESGDETPPELRDAADLILDGPAGVAAWLTDLRDRLGR